MRRLELAILIGLLTAAPLPATTLERMSLAQLTHRAPVIVQARCLASVSRWEQGEIWTFTRCAVSQTLKGSPAAVVVIRVLGGRVGGIVSLVEATPQFRPGQEVILFLQPTGRGDYGVVGWSEGSFAIYRAADGKLRVRQTSAHTAVYDARQRRFVPAGIPAMPLDQFLARVRRLVQEQP